MGKKRSEVKFEDMFDGLKLIITAKNQEQKEFLKTIKTNTVTFVKGPAGTGKTYLAVAYALQQLYKGNVEKLVFTRPVIEAAGERLGFLPGEIYHKIEPYMQPIFDSLLKLMPSELLSKLTHKNGHDAAIRVLPLAYMRGLAQPMYSKILTKAGWTTMGGIAPGNYVIGSDGKPTKVKNVYHHKQKKVYRISFSDGSFTDCCDEHLWLTRTLSEKRHAKPFSVKTTSQIMKTVKTRFGQKNHEIPVVSEPVEFASKIVDIDPYLLGLLLGDGSLHETAAIQFTTKDTEIIDSIQDVLKNSGVTITYAGKYDYRLSKQGSGSNTLRDAIRQLGLLGTTSHTKFIPDIYKYNDVHIRTEVLRGLMDTDGCITKHRSGNRRLNYYSVSEKLSNDVIEIIQSLGGVAHKHLKKFKKKTSTLVDGQYKWIETNAVSDIWEVDILYDNENLFRLRRKADVYATSTSPRIKRLVSDVSYIGEMECQCIAVENDDNLYLTDNYIVTHNTFENTFVVCDEMQNSKPEQMRMLLTRIGDNCKMIISGDTLQTDVTGVNGLDDAFDLLEGVGDLGFIELSSECIVRHPLVQKIEERYYNRAKEKKAKEDSRKTPEVATQLNKANVVCWNRLPRG